MSSDRRGSGGDPTTAEELANEESANGAAPRDGDVSSGIADDAQADDPWFAPGPKKLVSPDSTDADSDSDGSAGASAVDGRPGQSEWFLRTGRAGLHPDSVPDWAGEQEDPPSADDEHRVTSAGAPPWAGETTDVSAGTRPPWETGPWPSPDDLRSSGARAADERDHQAGLPASPNGAGPAGPAVRWPARTVVTAGLVPLVVPGLVLGVLSLRQAGGAAVRKASWLAIGASLAWAVIIIVIAASVSGGPAASCSAYPPAVHQAYEKALADLSGHAPAAVQAADLETAASLANASAAAAGQIGVRAGLFTMADDMAQARADVAAQRPIPLALRQHLAGDGAVPSGACGS